MERCRGTVAGGFAPGQDEAALVTRNEIAQLLSVGKRANKDEERAGRNGLPSLTAGAAQPLDPLGPQLPRYLCAIGSGSPSGSPAFTYPSV